MSHTPHALADEFPDQIEALRDLRMRDASAARLVDEYTEINETLFLVETNKEPMGDIEALRLRKTRIMLRDEINRLLH